MSMDVEHARFNMVEQQIRPWEVLDPKELALLHQVHREDFVPQTHKALAFADLEIPLGHGEKMLTPKLEARILQELAINPADRVLEVGTGSGYMTALLASQAAHVYSVELIETFIHDARLKLAHYGIANVTLECGDAARGWDKHEPYDVIVLTGSVPLLPEAFTKVLAPMGRLFAVVGEAPAMEARLITSAGGDAYSTASLFETCIPALRNALQPARFSF